MIKAIFFDIDGTLISFKTHQMPNTTQKALVELRKKGIKLFVATGRPPAETKFLSQWFDFDGFITMNGQYCFNQNDKIHEQYIPESELSAILPYLEQKDIACGFVELNYSYMNKINSKVMELRNLLGATIIEESIDNPNRIFKNKTYQLNAYITEDEEQEFFKYIPNCKSARWNPIFTDIIPKDGGKPVGIKKVLDYYEIPLENSMAFGDGGNDKEMLKYINIGIAMGNATDDVKRVADYTTLDIDDDGILYALKQFNIL